MIPENEFIKKNLLELAKNHKENCKNENCKIMLISIYLALNKLDIKMSDEEASILLL